LDKGIENALQGMDPRSWLQSIIHSLLGASITFTVLFLIICCIGYFCFQQQLQSYKTSESMITLGLLHLKNKKGGIFRASRGTLPV
jgi:amino acid permease